MEKVGKIEKRHELEITDKGSAIKSIVDFKTEIGKSSLSVELEFLNDITIFIISMGSVGSKKKLLLFLIPKPFKYVEESLPAV